jgi:hypothetical protein
MKPFISIAWQPTLKWSVRLLSLGSVVLGFVALDPLVAGSIGVAILSLNLFLERVRFYAGVLHVMPFPSPYVIQNKLASLWAVEDYKGEPTLLFGQVFRTERAAKRSVSSTASMELRRLYRSARQYCPERYTRRTRPIYTFAFPWRARCKWSRAIDGSGEYWREGDGGGVQTDFHICNLCGLLEPTEHAKRYGKTAGFRQGIA